MAQKRVFTRLLHVEMTLRNVLYISYAVPAGKLRSLVPDILPLSTIGDDIAFISIVVLQSTQVRLGLMPLRFDYHQLNIRTYVVDPVSGKHAVYFLRSGVTSRFISLVTRMSGIPWQLVDLETEVNPQNGTDSYVASGNWEGRFILKAQIYSDDPKETPFFENRDTAVDFLIRPLIGFVGDNRRLGRFTIQHPEVEPQSYTLMGLDFPLFTSLGAVDESSNPHSVFFLPKADFSIYLPPTRIK
ncbi:DUF2071 domain-containing protein [Chloroflexota bacterium]